MNFQGITIGYKVENTEIMIEAPLTREKDFMTLSCTTLNENGIEFFKRQIFETVGGRKHKLLLSQRYKILKSGHNLIKPVFLHLYKDYLNFKKAKIVNYLDLD